VNAIEMLFLIVFFFLSLVFGDVLQKWYGVKGLIGGFAIGSLLCLVVYWLIHRLITGRSKR
jgi:hypothetical protein